MQQINSLQSLRFLFAMMIFFHHFLVIDGVGLFDVGGPCAVSFFFITSGFVMTAGYGEKVVKSDFSYSSFLKKRIIRIYPLHLLCYLIATAIVLCAMVLHHEVHYGILAYMVANLLLLQSWIPTSVAYFSGNPVSWFLSDMLFFYIMFPLLIRVINRLKQHWIYLLFAMILGGYFFAAVIIPDKYVHALLYINPLFRSVDFIIGIVLYNALSEVIKKGYVDKIRRISFIKKSFIEILCMMIFATAVIYGELIPDKFLFAGYFWMPMVFLLSVFVLFDRAGGIVTQILNNHTLTYLGSLSFTFYMIHLMVIHYSNAFLMKQKIDLSLECLIPIYLICITFLSYLINKYYERPVVSFFNKKQK